MGSIRGLVPLLAIAALAALAACTGAVPDAPGGSSPAQKQSVSVSPSADASSAPAPRTTASLNPALLAVADLPPGFTRVPTTASGGTLSSPDPNCATLVMILNTPHAIGTLTQVDARFSKGDLGPFIDEQIGALASSTAVAAEQAQLETAVAGCPQVTLTEPGHASSPMLIHPVNPPSGGENPVAFRATVSGPGPAGFEFTQVLAGVGDTVVTVSVVRAQASEVDGIARAAVDKAARVLKANRSGAS